MLEFVPLDLLDNFLMDRNAGEALLVLFLLSVVATLPLSRKLFSINTMIFGLLFFLIPSGLAPIEYKLLGLLLIVIAPVVYTSVDR